MRETKSSDPFLPVRNSDEAVQKVVREVLKLERDKLHQKKVSLISDITRIIKDTIK